MGEAEEAWCQRCLKRQGAIDAILEKTGVANDPVLEIPDACDVSIEEKVGVQIDAVEGALAGM